MVRLLDKRQADNSSDEQSKRVRVDELALVPTLAKRSLAIVFYQVWPSQTNSGQHQLWPNQVWTNFGQTKPSFANTIFQVLKVGWWWWEGEEGGGSGFKFVGAPQVGPKGGEGANISRFFPSPATIFFLSSFSWRSSR